MSGLSIPASARIDMSYVINKSEEIIFVTYSGAIDLAERKQAVEEACMLIDSSQPLILIDIRNVAVEMSINELQEFAAFLASRDKLKGAKVAVLRSQDRAHPNLFLESFAYAEGFTMVPFNDLQKSKNWLLGHIK